MMRGSEKTELCCECDGCGQEVFGGTLSFQEFIQDLKGQGWKMRKDEETWEHFCPDCA